MCQHKKHTLILAETTEWIQKNTETCSADILTYKIESTLTEVLFKLQQESLQGYVEINFPLEMLLFICCLPPDLTLKIAVRERREGEELFCIALLVVVSESLTAARILFF